MHQTSTNFKSLVDAYVETASITENTTSDGRTYLTPSGEKYPSVTTILSAMEDKTWLYEWRKRVGDAEATRITNESSSRGTSMHSLCESHFKSEPIDTSAEGFKMFKSLRIYLDNIDPLGMEVPLWSDTLKTAGRTDVVGLYKGQLAIIDYKTSRREKTADQIGNYFLQSTIYSMMALERIKIPAKKIVILIAVDNGFPQEFIRDTKEFIPDALAICKKYHATHP